MANVLSLVPYKVFPANLGGQRVITYFNKYLSRYHSLTCVMVKKERPPLVNYSVINFFLDSKLRYINIFSFFSLEKIIRNSKITHVIVEHPFMGWLGILLKKANNIQLILHSHNIESQRFKSLGKWWWKFLWYYERWVHSNADLTFCITEEDRQYMLTEYHIAPQKCHLITYGLDWEIPPSELEKAASRKELISKYGLKEDTILYLFNGALDYGPNYQAVKNIIQNIEPLLAIKITDFKLIICGKGIKENDSILSQLNSQHIIYAGFVDDINLYFKGCDIFINPVINGGGIKTKLVEALGNDLETVSCLTGAIGIDPMICNNKLHIVNDNDWEIFVEEMILAKNNNKHIGQDFFSHFYWDNIAKKAADLIY